MILVKSHGLGNDYLVLDRWSADRPAPSPGLDLSPAAARLLCDRSRGVGADGVLEPVPSTRARAGLRIWNPDGSLAEKSGNGLRIFARFLVDRRGAPAGFQVEVAAGVVGCRVDPEQVTVEMGRATLEPREIPALETLRLSPVRLGETTLRVTAVGLGNPHAVVLLEEDLDSHPWRAWGAALERHPLFPNRTNVQFARVLGPDLVEARVWERGAGETASSGSSACAVAVAAFELGLVGPELRVRMPGGALEVSVSPTREVTLRGPVEEVGEIRLSEAMTKKLMAMG